MEDIGLGSVISGAVRQFIVLLIIPVLWWAVKWRKKTSFREFFGLYFPKQVDTKRAVFIIGLYIVFWIVSHLPAITQITQPSANQYLNKGVQAIVPALIVGFIQTALCEEILFRGFILKRLKNMMSENAALLLQAVIFALVHNLFEGSAPLSTHIIVFIPPFLGGYLLGYMNEKIFKGSILPSAALHGFGNAFINLSRVFGFWM